MNKKVDWGTTLKDWVPSRGAIPVHDPSELKAIGRFMKFVGQSIYDKIELFDSGGFPPKSKKFLEIDQIEKNEVFTVGYEQLSEHGQVFEVHLDVRAQRTFEMPFASPTNDKLRYFKFQFRERNSLHNPNRSNVKRVGLSYHEPDKGDLEVVYEK